MDCFAEVFVVLELGVTSQPLGFAHVAGRYAIFHVAITSNPCNPKISVEQIIVEKKFLLLFC